MLKAPLGNNGPLLNRLGYGAMVLEGIYGAANESDGVNTLCHAMDAGMMIDTADAYGNGHNERLLAKAIKSYDGDAFIASKFGIVFDEGVPYRPISTGWGFDININASAEYVGKAIDASLSRLDLECVDLWYVHFPDPATPIEDTVAAMAKQVAKGKVKYLGLSNVSAEQVKQAHAVHPIHAVQYEYSLFRREAEISLLPTLRELGIALVAWSPLGAGFLTGNMNSLEDGDFRQNNPKLAGESLSRNQDRFAPFRGLAATLDITPAQLSLAWLLHQGDDIFPIPGTRKTTRIDENNASADVKLSMDVLNEIDKIAALGSIEGDTLI